MTDLFSPLQLGSINLNNRIVMAPMTRSRAETDGSPNALMAEYYRQRATAGLIITEGVYPSENGKGYCRTPGLVTDAHIRGWQQVVNAVKAEGGSIVMQLMHCGRIASAANKQPGTETVAPSAIQANGEMFTEQGMLPFDQPRALSTDEIAEVINEYKRTTELALEIGFDGVELHCTSGYLPAQFLSTGTNHRDDEYGGSLENRCRFVLETLQAISSVDGSGRVGMRICPGNPFNDLHDDNPLETFRHLLQQVKALDLAYLHAIKSPHKDIDVVELAKQDFQGPLIINDGFEFDTATEAVQQGVAEAVSFGRHFIGNPDLVRRFKEQLSLSGFEMGSLYTPGAEGYTDYPETSS